MSHVFLRSAAVRIRDSNQRIESITVRSIASLPDCNVPRALKETSTAFLFLNVKSFMQRCIVRRVPELLKDSVWQLKDSCHWISSMFLFIQVRTLIQELQLLSAISPECGIVGASLFKFFLKCSIVFRSFSRCENIRRKYSFRCRIVSKLFRR